MIYIMAPERRYPMLKVCCADLLELLHYLDSQIVPGHHVSAAGGELHVRDGRDDLREEGFSGGILRLFEHCKYRAYEGSLVHAHTH